jgi:2'-5' RNA ligase
LVTQLGALLAIIIVHIAPIPPLMPLRLFLAIDLPPALRSNIDRWRHDRFHGRPEATANLHITLVFLGDVQLENVDRIRQLAADTTFTAFDLRLDRVRRWQNGVLHLAPSRAPPALLELQRALNDGVRDLGMPTERRRYSPHLTLAREMPRVERLPRCPVFHWRVDRLTLFSSEHSDDILQYRSMGEWAARSHAA